MEHLEASESLKLVLALQLLFPTRADQTLLNTEGSILEDHLTIMDLSNIISPLLTSVLFRLYGRQAETEKVRPRGRHLPPPKPESSALCNTWLLQVNEYLPAQ